MTDEQEKEKEITKNVNVSGRTHLIISALALVQKKQLGDIIDLGIESYVNSLPDKLKSAIRAFTSIQE